MLIERRPKHSLLYYRNALIVIGCFVFTFGVALVRGLGPLSMLWFLPLLFIDYSVWLMVASVHPPRRRLPHQTPASFDMQYEDVEFPSRDGLRLTGWYIPGRNRAAVILVHRAGRGKATMLEQARLLATEGFGVLLFDLRGHGASEGDTLNGVDEANDLLGAVDYLLRRSDVDRGRIGAHGILLGASVVLRAAAGSDAIRAVVLESLGPACLEDHGEPATLWDALNHPVLWYIYHMGDFIAGKKVTEGVRRLLPRLGSRPVMLIATGRDAEVRFNRLCHALVAGPKSLWDVPRAHRGIAYLLEPEAYREKVRAFFTRYLLAGR